MSRIIPRYLYHFTNKNAYSSIIKDGFLKPSYSVFTGKNVHFVELDNYVKTWGDCYNNRGRKILPALLSQVKKDSADLVLLKINTDKLDSEKLKIHSENKNFKFVKENFKKLEELFEYVVKNNIKEEEGIKLVNKELGIENTIIANGDSARNRRLYEQRKEALEYLYPHQIPTSNIEKIGEVDLTTIEYNRFEHPYMYSWQVLEKLLSGTAEMLNLFNLKVFFE